MTTNTNVDRRTVLKVASGSILAGGVGSVRGVSLPNQNSVTLVEAGLRYSIPEDASYERYHVDRLTEYQVDSNQGKLALRPVARPETKSLFTSSDVAVNAKELTNERVTVASDSSTTELPTELGGRYQLDRYVALAEPVTEPQVEIVPNGGNPLLRTGSRVVDLPEGEETTVALEPETATVRTRVVTDEKADIPGVPEEALGYKVERGTTEVTVVPEVVATNFGELEVIEAVG